MAVRSKLQIFKRFEDIFGWQIAIFIDERTDEEKESACIRMIACHKFYLEHKQEIPIELKLELDKLAEMAEELILLYEPPDWK